MNCIEVQSRFSSYLDGAVTGAEMHAIGAHLEGCGECENEYQRLARAQKLVASLGRKQAPPNLALRLHVALSQAAAESWRNRLEALQMRWSYTIQGFMFPATAGLVSALLFFALLIGYITIPQKVEASSADQTPLMLYTPAQLNSSPFITTVGNIEGSLVVETYVDSQGRVEDYRIISAPDGTERLIPQLDNMLIFTTFRPAMNLGRPTSSHVVLSFSGVNVRG
jgi:hypothetical protein